uniref:4-diphosphocytidyl-2-C-methyl-D-erythritol kinase n=1 Tax=Candidatus Kentrum sp. FM TaxID=2126340 RepID=A0A450T7D7_9GAMM|nr:MAG: 4-diphosphocytidyl-2-C-methyl-D-erythritol kinase [Candidatus Kentron sp. FM]VFJ62659.1 MAG: 4-diphosphocytidyl-2-C-methyl-D-erythritol kinase [Candidatus Kentron sp. FM]VFK09721.1 MAG: 4-diphosphocytidyl-2-C-methyl-D-erythritol kinase [Candidatus Kentron sp. FM]
MKSNTGTNRLPVWPAPGKINLFLHITGRRADGYHNLETIFQFLDLTDEITLRVRSDGRIRRITDPGSGLAGVPEQNDITVRAAHLLKRTTGTPLGADIAITKRIPMGAGLGGGSSDAATTLVGLDHLWGLGLGVETLAGIGLTLGADVPVFVRGQAAFAAGVGEKLTPIEPPMVLEEPWYLIVYPGCSVATADIFNAPDLTRDTPPIKIHTLSPKKSALEKSAPEGATPGKIAQQGPLLSPWSLSTRTRNDCEALARRRYPPVDAALGWLSQFSIARMTGTGSCVFAPFRERQEAERALAMLPKGQGMVNKTGAKGQGWSGFVARGWNRSPLRIDGEPPR